MYLLRPLRILEYPFPPAAPGAADAAAVVGGKAAAEPSRPHASPAPLEGAAEATLLSKES